jgi:hypothetical protein
MKELLLVSSPMRLRASPVPTTTATFTEQVGDALNPERGWWRETAIGGSLGRIR